MTKVIGVLALGMAAAVAWQTAAPADPVSHPRTCILMRSIHNWTDVDDRTAILEVSADRRYKVTFWGSCREMSRSVFARVDRSPSAGLCLERGDVLVFGEGLSVTREVFPDRWHRPAFEERCVIDSIEELPSRVNGADGHSSY